MENKVQVALWLKIPWIFSTEKSKATFTSFFFLNWGIESIQGLKVYRAIKTAQSDYVSSNPKTSLELAGDPTPQVSTWTLHRHAPTQTIITQCS